MHFFAVRQGKPPDASEFMEIGVEKSMDFLKRVLNSERIFIYHASFN